MCASVCMCVMYVYLCVSVNISMCVRMFVCVYIRVCVCVYVCIQGRSQGVIGGQKTPHKNCS